jgi:tRNA-uridine 2-sulfurtransferase
MCNKHVKFGAFMKFAKDNQADFIATGHYVRRQESVPHPELHRGIDPDKDQSYFLHSLTNEQLDFSLFPIGDTIKDHIRLEAKTAEIPTALKKDSQGICFLGHVDIREFLSHYTTLTPGLVENEAGEVVGHHDGALIYTPGQRHGLTITTKEKAREPYYVTRKDMSRNVVVVSNHKPTTVATTSISLRSVVLRQPIETGSQLETQSRYRQTPFLVEVIKQTGDTLELKVITPTDTIVSGQSCVLYKGTLCIGGGIIV